MSRSGTITLLGAGASADAGYPTADALLERFKVTVDETTRVELEHRRQMMTKRRELEHQAANTASRETVPLSDAGSRPTTAEWFQTMWERFEAVTRRVRPLAVPQLRPDGRPDLPGLVLYGYVFPPYGAPFEGEVPSPPEVPYLETFFAFYDDYMRPIIAAREGDPSALRTAQYEFRRLREVGPSA